MTKTRHLYCNNPNCPHENVLKFNDWVRKNLPDSSTGLSVSNIDFVIWNWKTNKMIMLEVKTNDDEIRKGQKMMLANVHKWINKGVDKNWDFRGINLVTFENLDFTDGKAKLNNKPVTEQELIKILSLN